MSRGAKVIKQKNKQGKAVKSNVPRKKIKEKRIHFLPWALLAIAITAICFLPMLKNQFTNWDDEFYVVKNSLLRGPDWKGVFTQPVVSNYHPLTIITFVIN